MDALDNPLRDSTVQIDLFPVAYLRSRDETAINNAEGLTWEHAQTFPYNESLHIL